MKPVYNKFKQDKKAMGVIQIIITLVISLVVLFILIFAFKDKAGIFDFNVKSCDSKGGTCMQSASECNGGTAPFKCPKDYPICCLDY